MVHMLLNKKVSLKRNYDVTLFQTPKYGQTKGYKQVYRLGLEARNHREVLSTIYRMFNVYDLLPEDYEARYVTTGDIVLIDEGWKGQTYYKLFPGGWQKINRIHIR